MIYSYYSLDWYIYINKKILSLLPCHISTNESARRAGCRLHECVRCRSLIDVTVRVSLLEEAWPYCSSLPRCPFTHMTYSLFHCHTHTHIYNIVQWLQISFLLPPSVVFFPHYSITVESWKLALVITGSQLYVLRWHTGHYQPFSI